MDQRSRTGRLEPEHRGRRRDAARRRVFAEPRPIGADIARVADRDREDIRRPAEVVANLERTGLLALEPERVDRIDEGHRMVVLLGQPANDPQRSIEVPVDGHDARSRDDGLEELAHRDLARREDDDDLEAMGCAICGSRRGRVAGRGADDRPRAALDGLGDSDDHAPILERARRVLALDLCVEVGKAQPGAEPTEVDERGQTLAEADHGCRVGDRQERLIALDERRPGKSIDGRVRAHDATAGGRPAHVLPSSREMAMRSPRTALDVAGPPAPGPLNATVPTGSASISIRLVTPDVRPSAASAGTAVGSTDALSVPSGPRRASAMSLMTRPAAVAAATSAEPMPVIPGRPLPGPSIAIVATLDGSSQTPNASRARITSLLTASSPSTSPRGSASA